MSGVGRDLFTETTKFLLTKVGWEGSLVCLVGDRPPGLEVGGLLEQNPYSFCLLVFRFDPTYNTRKSNRVSLPTSVGTVDH